MSTKHNVEIIYKSTIEIDSHADIHFFAKNFQIISSTEQVFSVTALLKELAATNNVTIVTADASMIDDGGAVFITVFVQGLDFTDKMDNSLIKTNPCRSFSV